MRGLPSRRQATHYETINLKMKRGRMKKFMGKKLGVWFSVMIGTIALLVIVVPTIAAEPVATDADNSDNPPPVYVPVILDGKLYQPDEFNRINTESHAKGVYLNSVVDPKNGTLMAFTSIDGMDKWLKENNLLTAQSILESAKKAGPATIEVLEPNEKTKDAGAKSTPSDMVENWVDINYGGWGFCVGFGIMNTLGYYDDKISSIITGSQAAEIIWEYSYQSGSSLLLFGNPGEGYFPNLHSIGWGDRASSLAVGSKS